MVGKAPSLSPLTLQSADEARQAERASEASLLFSVQAYSSNGRRTLLQSVRLPDRLEKRGLSQSLIQPIPADLRAQIRTEEEREKGVDTHT